ncbi:MAG: hypothetical protein JWO20_592 [Candidatus Angelobacter sp.]|nr:hypothetical protein [Candidatus Angelobacter sp.]
MNMLARAITGAFLLASTYALSYPVPMPGTEPIPELMAKATLVCKGLVTDATPRTFADDPPKLTGIATVHVDRCFKGDPSSTDIAVQFDSVLPAGGGPAIVLRNGDYYLFFLQSKDGKYFPFDKFFSVLDISRLQGPVVPGVTGPMLLLEIDLKAGLKDANGDRVLDSIRMLGNMRHLQSTKELKELLRSRNELIRVYVYEALLRLSDYSVLKSVREFLANKPEAPGSIYLPQDRLLYMQSQLASEIASIRDPAQLPELEQFLLSPNRFTRAQALQAVRAINSPHSAPFFYKLLDDTDVDNRFGAMQGLLTIAGGGPIPWVPSWDEFRRDPGPYAAKCKQWWDVEGKYKAFYQSPPKNQSYPFLDPRQH